MKVSRGVWLVGLVVLAGACGGKVFVDTPGAGGSGASGSGSTASGTSDPCAGKVCGDPCEVCPGCEALAFCNSAGECVLGDDVACPVDDEGPCAGAACGDDCVVCNDIECLDGFCGGDGQCEPFPPACP